MNRIEDILSAYLDSDIHIIVLLVVIYLHRTVNWICPSTRYIRLVDFRLDCFWDHHFQGSHHVRHDISRHYFFIQQVSIWRISGEGSSSDLIELARHLENGLWCSPSSGCRKGYHSFFELLNSTPRASRMTGTIVQTGLYHLP